MEVGGITVKSQKLGQADVVAAFFEDTPTDGILGLAFPDLSVPPGLPTPFDSMISQGLLAEDLFFSYFTSDTKSGNDESFFMFGGVDTSKLANPSGGFTYIDVIVPSYWLIPMEHVSVGSSVAYKCKLDFCFAVVDTGTTILAGPSTDIDPVMKAIGPVAQDCSNVKSLPTVSLHIAGKDWEIAPELYVLREQVNATSVECALGMESIPVAEAGPLWILGDVFLRSVAVVWDKSQSPPRVGFAKSTAALPVFD